MGLFDATLLLATFLVALVAGFLFAFVIVAMPGLGRLDDGAFLRAFQVMDRVIQSNQPLFILVWVGSVVALLAATVLGFGRLEGIERGLLVAAALVYILGVQLPTATINVPLNNRLQTLDVAAMEAATLRTEREAFEPRWNRWNAIRTIMACLTTMLLLALLFRL